MPLVWFDSNHSETEPSVLPVLTELGSKHTLQKKHWSGNCFAVSSWGKLTL